VLLNIKKEIQIINSIFWTDLKNSTFNGLIMRCIDQHTILVRP